MPASQLSSSIKLQSEGSLPMKVLLVEDSVLIRDALIEILSGAKNLTVDGIAATQNNALALLDTQQFDMLLLDIELAEGNGFEVISQHN